MCPDVASGTDSKVERPSATFSTWTRSHYGPGMSQTFRVVKRRLMVSRRGRMITADGFELLEGTGHANGNHEEATRKSGMVKYLD